jgi:predicted exporter
VSLDRRALIAGCALLVLLGTFLALRMRVATDITHFLPTGSSADAASINSVQLARELASGELSRTMVILVDAPDSATAVQASVRFEAALLANATVEQGTARLVAGSGEGVEDAMWQLYAPHRCAFLAEDAAAAAELLTDESLQKSAADLKRKLATPMSTFLIKVVPSDPLLILPQLFERFMGERSGGLKLIDGRFLTDKEDAGVLFLTTSTPTSDASALRPLIAGIRGAFDQVNAEFDDKLALHMSGTHLFALAAEGSIKSDIQRVSIGSVVGLVTLFLVIFRSLRLMMMVLPILVMGFLAGSSACLVFFGSVHGLTLAFGAALIGVSVDYGVHFHCHHLHAGGKAGARQSLRSIWPGLSLGAATTITGFLALIVSDFPGLRQLAVFAVFGIAAAALSTHLFLPALASRDRSTTKTADWIVALLSRVWFGETRNRALLAAPLVVVVIVAAIGLPQLRWNDGLADLNKIDPVLEANDLAVRNRVVRFEQRRLVVATGKTEELALQANDKIAKALSQLQDRNGLKGYRSLAQMLPSAQTQEAVDATIRSDQSLWPRLERVFAKEQFVVSALQPWRDLVAAPAPPPLTFQELADSALAAMVQPFRFTWSDGVGFVSFLDELSDEQGLRDALATIPGGDLIDITGTLSSAYGAYRERLLQLWLIGLGAVLLLVALRHRALRPTLTAYLPAILGAAGTAGILSLCGLALNMLSLVALLMVVSMGVDYGVFLAEHRKDAKARAATLLAIVLAGTSTMLGFGLLALSSQPPLFHIGLTSSVGVLLCLLLAPTVCALTTPPEPSDPPKPPCTDS